MSRVLKVERCERVQLVAAAVRLYIASCHDCVFYLGVNRAPLLLGDNRFLQVCTGLILVFRSQLQSPHDPASAFMLHLSAYAWPEACVRSKKDDTSGAGPCSDCISVIIAIQSWHRVSVPGCPH